MYKFDLHRDGIQGVEVAGSDVIHAPQQYVHYWQYALGCHFYGDDFELFRREAREHGTYGGWRWEGYLHSVRDAKKYIQAMEGDKPGREYEAGLYDACGEILYVTEKGNVWCIEAYGLGCKPVVAPNYPARYLVPRGSKMLRAERAAAYQHIQLP